MVPKVKGQKASALSISFAGDNKRILNAVLKIAENKQHDKAFTVCRLLKTNPEIEEILRNEYV